MKAKSFQLTGLLMLATLAIASTGCMMTPGNEETVGHKNDPVQFLGALAEPNKWVEIQARHRSTGEWMHVAYARSSSSSLTYFGRQWYTWSATETVPHLAWHINGSPYEWRAEVRAIDWATKQPVYTFEEGFFTYLKKYSSLESLWQEQGHGTSVMINGYVD